MNEEDHAPKTAAFGLSSRNTECPRGGDAVHVHHGIYPESELPPHLRCDLVLGQEEIHHPLQAEGTWGLARVVP